MAAEQIPNPGSKEAVSQGCRCPRVDNHYGRGYMGGIKDGNGMTLYAIHEGCKLHGVGTAYWNVGREAEGGS